MAVLIAVCSALLIALSIPLAAMKPQWVFYLLLLVTMFDSLFNGYIDSANNLGMPLAWTPADGIAWVTLLAAFMLPRPAIQRTHIEIILLLLGVCTVLSLAQGLAMYTTSALSESRVVHCMAAMLFGLRYLTNWQRVEEFLKFVVVALLIMFAFHVIIRLGIYAPPILARKASGHYQLEGERGGISLVPMLNLILVSVATARLACKRGSLISSSLLLLVGLAGVALSETRSLYGAVVVIALAAIIFVQGRLRTGLVYGLALVFAVYAAAMMDFDLLARFRSKYGRGQASVRVQDRVREQELTTIVDSYAVDPQWIVTGRGIGAAHLLPGHGQLFRTYYHCEYLGWLDRCGLIGLVGFLVLLCSVSFRSLWMARLENPRMRFYGMACFMLFAGLMAEGVFHPVLSHKRAGSLVMCFFVIIANWERIYQSLYAPQGQDLSYSVSGSEPRSGWTGEPGACEFPGSPR